LKTFTASRAQRNGPTRFTDITFWKVSGRYYLWKSHLA
jgi:hypothetical protein